MDVSSYFAPSCPLSSRPPGTLSRDLGEAGPTVLSSVSSISVVVKCARDKEKQRPEARTCLGSVPAAVMADRAHTGDQGDKEG